MPHVQGVSRDTTYLLPPSLDDYISTDNPVRFLDMVAKNSFPYCLISVLTFDSVRYDEL